VFDAALGIATAGGGEPDTGTDVVGGPEVDAARDSVVAGTAVAVPEGTVVTLVVDAGCGFVTGDAGADEGTG
jgi:hypothetical protein